MRKIAVLFGGRSLEHDVSILTGVQVCQVMDATKYIPVPVYVDKSGVWRTGDVLMDMRSYPLVRRLAEVELRLGGDPGLFERGFFGAGRMGVDAAFLAFHGGAGESGLVQGALDIAGIPYAGMGPLGSGVSMDKVATKRFCRDLGINVLSEVVLARPDSDFVDIASITKGLGIRFPALVKPVHLGSSIGVRRADNADALGAALLDAWVIDDLVMVEPFVENLVEYNVAVMRSGGATVTSAIESPSGGGGVLSFGDKYLSKDGGKKKGLSSSAMPLDELVNSRREFNPSITAAQEKFIRSSAVRLYEALGARGSPRIDYLCDKGTGEVWLNEVNPIPGSIAFYLWEKSEHKISYSKLVSILIEEALAGFSAARAIDLAASGAEIFK
ncbi:MAG: hypothetical protein LBT92_02520 [Rickettsiales bacterium]|jgi:D-alanine-D-alanine ligase|nr:hypothetical protein [Rickettsiales bacterium]